LRHDLELTEEPYFGILWRGLRRWRDLQKGRFKLATDPPVPSIFIDLTARLVAAYVRANPVPADALPQLIESIHRTILQLADVPDAGPSLKPAVPVRRSVADDYIVCLEDGKKLKMLKRYLRSRYNMSPEDYRVRWGLPPDYPMVAPNYAARRSEFAKRIGLGRRPGRGKRRKG
jgi:predicted transcriptional regulator